jgi:hypothetical protein
MGRTKVEQPIELSRMRGRLDEFRRGSRPGKALPQWAWPTAGRLARRYGVHATARALGLEYNKLKRASGARTVPTAGRTARRQRTGTGSAVKFVELGGLTPPTGVAAGEAFVEVVAADGVRVAVRLKDSSPALLAVIGALRGRS